MIDKLPVEIIEVICGFSGQFALVHLGQTCSHLHEIVERRLYESVTIDSSRNGSHEDSYKTTTIRSLHSLTLFLKNIVSNRHYGKFIRSLVFDNEIPDMPEITLNAYIDSIFPTLHNLRCLRWFVVDTYLGCDLIEKLPLAKLVSLGGNFKNFETQTAFIPTILPSLKSLNVSGFNTAANLSLVDLDKCPNLEDLTISKNSCGTSKRISNLIEIDPCNKNYLSEVFTCVPRLSLSSLTLKDISVASSDAQKLIGCVDLVHLQHFSMINCTETLFEDNSTIRRIAPPVVFLDAIAPFLDGLKRLRLDLTNELFDNESIINLLDSLQLEEFDVLLKCRNGECLDDDISKLIGALELHPLRKLKIDFQITQSYIKHNHGVSIKALHNLATLTSLEALQIPVHQKEIIDIQPLISNLPNLTTLHLIVNSYKPSNNSLINQDYFNFVVPCTLNLETSSESQFIKYCSGFKFSNKNLQYLIFETLQKYTFECFNKIQLIR